MIETYSNDIPFKMLSSVLTTEVVSNHEVIGTLKKIKK